MTGVLVRRGSLNRDSREERPCEDPGEDGHRQVEGRGLRRNQPVTPWCGLPASSSVQLSLSVVSNILWSHEPQHARPPVHHQLPEPPKPMSMSMMPSNHLILCRPLLLLPSIFPIIKVFSNKLALHIRWPKYWSFSFSISPSNKYSGLIFFRINWLDSLESKGL